ncbi:MaoC family dehydratase, partial [Bacteroides sp. OttesenSCG-928-J23]|nr:MaoC family dehydratase [Bacteroides sp. OttesenSCG-928-J23]
MFMLVINSFSEFEQYIGRELGVSDYLTVTQEQINRFADATFDHQWIHVDTEKAKAESPYKNTIAHGYLTLSVLPYLWAQIADVRNVTS